MKINEKTVAHYVSSNSDKEGWLFKRGEVNRAYQRRWFVLRGNIMCYFERKFDPTPIGAIVLEGCRVEVDDIDAGLYCFKVAFAYRTYILASSRQDDMEEWVKVISRCSYKYLHLTLSEFEKQLFDLTMNQQQNSPTNQSSINPKMPSIFSTRKTFAEIHHHYEVQFQSYFAQQRKKHEGVGLLIDLS